VVFVAGPAGIGKTSVLEAGKRAAVRLGFRVASGVGSSMETGLAFGVVGQALVAVGGSTIEDVADLERPGGQATRLYRMFRWLQGVTADRPLLLALDDLHWADPDSLELIGFVCRRVTASPIVVLGSLRGEPNRAWLLARELAGAGRARLVSLEPLSREASAALLARTVHRSLDPGETDRVWRACAGTPLLLEAAAWTLDSGGSLPASSGAAAFAASLLLERFTGVGEDALGYVRAASVLGARFQAALAGALAGLGHVGWQTAHARLLRAGLLVDVGLGWAAFVHPLVAQALLDSQPLSGRERAHARAFRLLVERGEPDGMAAEHALAAGLVGDPQAIEITARAGRAALRQGALEAACAHLGNAVSLAGETAADELLLECAAALTARARIEEAEHACGVLLARVDLEPGVRTQALSLLARTAILAGRPADAECRCEQAAAAAATTGPALEAAALCTAAFACNLTSPLSWTLATVSRALAIVPAGEPERRQLEFLDAIARLQGGDGTGEELFASGARGWWRRSSQDDPSWAWTMPFYAMSTLRMLEDLGGTTDVFEREFQRAVKDGAPVMMSVLAIGYSDAVHRMGRPAEALELVQQAVALGDWAIAPWSDLSLAILLSDLGRDADAQPHIEALRSLTAGVPREYYGPISLWLCVLDSWRLLATGEAERASEMMLHAAEIASVTGWRHPSIVPWASVGIDAHLAAGRIDRAQALVGDLEQLARPLSCRWPRAVTQLGRAQLAAVDGRSEAADRGFANALGIFAELPFPLYHAEALISYGFYLRRSGRPRQAREPLARALEPSERAACERVARLARAELAAAGGRRRRHQEDRAKLTAQEQRVAALACDGLTNAQIAAALQLSPKTVGHHLEHVYAKLGIRSRRELRIQRPE
jgi:DNA-binding CsgD family transcriptional regulator